MPVKLLVVMCALQTVGAYGAKASDVNQGAVSPKPRSLRGKE